MEGSRNEYFKLSINGKHYQVGPDVPLETSLNTYIRDYANLTGTKIMCREGGCGACIVTKESTDPVTLKVQHEAVNSCLISVRSCHGCHITTVEGIGGKKTSYHKIQTYLAKFNGTQCGYCSPGMVMNMYSLLMDNPEITMKEVENSFGGNLCRCTGYRPIMDAFKALASDATPELKRQVADIEDLFVNCSNGMNGNCLEKCNGHCNGNGKPNNKNEEVTNKNGKVLKEIRSIGSTLSTGARWYRPNKVADVWKILQEIGDASYSFLGGNTAKGVYKKATSPSIYIDLNPIAELKTTKTMDNHIHIGANMTLTNALNLFKGYGNDENYSYLNELAEHLDLVANVPVRNIATMAGNLFTKHQHNDFPSDIFIMLETVRAQIILCNSSGDIGPMSMTDFLDSDLNNVLIKTIVLPPLPKKQYHIKTFKIMPRAQNVHAYLNAGFLFRLDENSTIMEKPTILFGGINSQFIHAQKTEQFLQGKNLLSNDVLKETFEILTKELQPDNNLLKPSAEYRKSLAVCLLYRCVLSVRPESLNTELRSGATNLKRKLGSSEQDKGTERADWPEDKINKKLEGLIQASGEAEYVNDLPPYPGQLYGALVLARQAVSVLQSLDPSEALAMDGVEAFFSAKDIPGKNNFMFPHLFTPDLEEIFCSSKVIYAGQPVGVIVADSYDLALKAATKVKVTYVNKEKPMLTVKDVLSNNVQSKIKHFSCNKTEEIKYNSKHIISGDIELGSQFHFTMELQSCICVPTEDGINVFSSTQWMQNIQATISSCLNIPENCINMQVRRLGGGFGSKITRSSMIANACAIAAYKLQRPVRMMLDIETNMEAVGKRCPAYSVYKVGFDGNGKIEAMDLKLYEDNGSSRNDPANMIIEEGIKNCYDAENWKIEIFDVLTDIPSCSWMRAPGTLEGMATIEHVMEHIATELGKSPLEVRLANFGNYPNLMKIIETIKESSNFDDRQRQISIFNRENRWKKRGISLMPMNFNIGFYFCYHAMLSIYASDGTVAVTTGGIEMGQGINTKVAQVCAYALGLSLDMIKVKPVSNLTAPNDGMSGASVTSDTCCYSALKCCEIMLKRLEPIKNKLGNPSWKELILAAHKQDIDLNVTYMNSTVRNDISNYEVYGVAVTEVEIDLLTGKYLILRADLLEDVGQSMSPYIDIGQIEGAFVMGLGYFLSEKLVFHPESGMNLSNRTWHYWPPGVKDIPADFRINIARNLPNQVGVMRAKTTGEPPLCLAFSSICAIRDALKSARREVGLENEWFNLDQPCTVEKIFLSAKTPLEQLRI